MVPGGGRRLRISTSTMTGRSNARISSISSATIRPPASAPGPGQAHGGGASTISNRAMSPTSRAPTGNGSAGGGRGPTRMQAGAAGATSVLALRMSKSIAARSRRVSII